MSFARREEALRQKASLKEAEAALKDAARREKEVSMAERSWLGQLNGLTRLGVRLDPIGFDGRFAGYEHTSCETGRHFEWVLVTLDYETLFHGQRVVSVLCFSGQRRSTYTPRCKLDSA